MVPLFSQQSGTDVVFLEMRIHLDITVGAE
jgi:hypothetical protein